MSAQKTTTHSQVSWKLPSQNWEAEIDRLEKEDEDGEYTWDENKLMAYKKILAETDKQLTECLEIMDLFNDDSLAVYDGIDEDFKQKRGLMVSLLSKFKKHVDGEFDGPAFQNLRQ